MADVTILSDPLTIIEYSVVDGRVKEFILKGETLFDEKEKIEVTGWQQKLADIVWDYGLDIDKGHGLHAFVYWMIEKELLQKEYA